MYRRSSLALSRAGLALVLAAAGCGGSGAPTGATEESPAPPVGHAVIVGTVVRGGIAASGGGSVHALSGDTGLLVTVVGTAAQAAVDEEGEFALVGVPAGTVTLHFEGPGTDAGLTVSGLVDGQVMSLEVHLSGNTAQTTSPPTCSPTKDVKFTGNLEQISTTTLVVSRRTVDLSALQKVWRNGRRTTLDDLEVGEKIKVWGKQRGDGVVLADEIEAGTFYQPGQEQRVSFRGTVQSVAFPAFAAASSVHASCYPTLVVSGRTVETDGGTRFKWSDGSGLDPSQVQVGDKAYVEGWLKAAGHVAATKIVITVR
jgi:Domain of unknown function (DUF5666)